MGTIAIALYFRKIGETDPAKFVATSRAYKGASVSLCSSSNYAMPQIMEQGKITCHMIATSLLLDPCLAFRACFRCRVDSLIAPLFFLLMCSKTRASQTFVPWDGARDTKALVAASASEYRLVCSSWMKLTGFTARSKTPSEIRRSGQTVKKSAIVPIFSLLSTRCSRSTNQRLLFERLRQSQPLDVLI